MTKNVIMIKCQHCQLHAEIIILDAGQKATVPIIEHCPACMVTLNPHPNLQIVNDDLN
jgi:uncharacterized paraquat-inducible protein A